MKTIAIYSPKGGVGKTTLSVNLAWASATLSSRRTLLWDLDPQAASSFLLGVGAGRQQAQAAFTKAAGIAELVRPTAYPRLGVIASDESLRELDLLLHGIAKKKRLHKLLETIADAYDRVVLDCPPGVTETSAQVLRAADLIVVPVVPSPLSTRALDELSRLVGDDVPILAVHSMVDRRRALHAAAIARHPDWPILPYASAVEAMGEKRAPIGSFARKSPAAEAFAQLWRSIERALVSAK